MDAAVEQRADRASGQTEGQHQEHEGGETPVADGCLHQEEDGDRGADGEAQRFTIRRLAGGEVPDDRRVILHRELDPAKSLSHVVGDGAEIAPRHRCRDVDAPGDVHVPDDGRRRSDPHGRHITQSHLPAGGKIDLQILDAGEVVPNLRRTPYDDVEHLLFVEETADLDPGKQGGRGPPNVSRHDLVALRRFEVDLDLERRLLGRAATRGSSIPSIPERTRFTSSALPRRIVRS